MDDATSLTKRRKALDLKQSELAVLLGITQGTVSRNEAAHEPDRRFELSLDALAARKEQGEDLAATARAMEEARAAA